MTTHGDMFDACAFPQLVSMFGEAITYTPSGEEAVSITALVTRDGGVAGAESKQADDGYGVLKTAKIEIYADAVNGVAAPAAGDTVTFDATTWGVQSAVVDGGIARIEVAAYSRSEMSRGGKRVWRQ